MANFGKLNFAVSFNPQTAFPLDARYYFESYELAAQAAAKAEAAGSTTSTYFFGQNIAVVENNVATLYVIQPDKTLKPVGSTPIGDGQSIEVVDEKIQIKGFGKGYYKYNADVEGHYEFIEGAFIAGLQPQIIASAEGTGFEIAWFEPNPTTVEGLETQISSLSSSVNTLSGKVDNNTKSIGQLETKVNSIEEAGYATQEWVEGKGYLTAHQDITGKVDRSELSDYYTKDQADAAFMTQDEVDARVNQVITDAVDGDTLTSLTELVDYINRHGGEAAEMAEAIDAIEKQLNGIEAETGAVKQYIDDEIAALNISQYATQTALNELTAVVNGKAEAEHTHEQYLTNDSQVITDIVNEAGEAYALAEGVQTLLDEHIEEAEAIRSDLDTLSGIVTGDENTEGTISYQIKAVKDSIPTTEAINALIIEKGYAEQSSVNEALAGLEESLGDIQTDVNVAGGTAAEALAKANEALQYHSALQDVIDQEVENLGNAISQAEARVEAKILVQSIDENQFKVEENKLSITKVSTDLLVQGSEELILNGGSAENTNKQ